MKVVYEPHPVSPERKAELRAQGLKIIDARFAPADAPAAEEKPKRRRKKAAPKPALIDKLEGEADAK